MCYASTALCVAPPQRFVLRLHNALCYASTALCVTPPQRFVLRLHSALCYASTVSYMPDSLSIVVACACIMTRVCLLPCTCRLVEGLAQASLPHGGEYTVLHTREFAKQQPRPWLDHDDKEVHDPASWLGWEMHLQSVRLCVCLASCTHRQGRRACANVTVLLVSE